MVVPVGGASCAAGKALSPHDMIHAILIDLDGVLRVWNPANDLEAEQASDLPSGAIWKAAFSSDLLLPAITGQISDDGWRRQVTDRLRFGYPNADVDKAVRLWSASCGEVNQEVLEVIRACRKKVRVALITNATSRLPLDLGRLKLTNEFDHIINSSEVGYVKPQAEIFYAGLGAVGVSAQECLFVDDNAEHVAAASRLGLVGHVYVGLGHLREELNRAGLP
jgi:putative hydrolase of the HAD superfamily